MPDPRNRNEAPVTLRLVLVWLLSVFVIGITLAVWADSLRFWEAEASAKLVSILVIFELVVYLVVLLLPTDQIVPPGRTALVALVGAGTRLMMALAAAKIVAGATLPLKEAWLEFYGGLWWVALIHIALVGVFLWLVRAALEEPRPSRRARRERAVREPFVFDEPEEDEPQADQKENPASQHERQHELLSALMERPDEPVTEEAGSIPAVLREPEQPAPITQPRPEGAYMPPEEPSPQSPEPVGAPSIELPSAIEEPAPPIVTPVAETEPVEQTSQPSRPRERPDRDGVDTVVAPEDLPRERPETSAPEALPTYDEPGDTTDHFPAVDVPIPQPATAAAASAVSEPPPTSIAPDAAEIEPEPEGDVFDHADPEPQTLRQAYLPVHPAVVSGRPHDTGDAPEPAQPPATVPELAEPSPSVPDEPAGAEPVPSGPASEAAEDKPEPETAPAAPSATGLPVFEEPPAELELEAPPTEPMLEPVVPESAALVEPAQPSVAAAEAPPEPPVPTRPQAPASPELEPETPEPEQTQLRIDEQPEPHAVTAAVQHGALPAAVDVVLRGAVADIAQQEPIETGASSSGRAYALVGMPDLVQRYGAEILDDLDLLVGAMAAATSAVCAGDPQSLVIVGDKGTLLAGVSADGSALLVVRAEAGIKMGRLRVAATRVKSVAGGMRGGGPCPIQAPALTALKQDSEVERQTAEQLGLQAGAFGGRDRMVLLMDGLASAGVVAAAGEAVFEAALTAAVYAGTGVIERLLVEGVDGGLVVGSCGSAGEVLVAVSAETAAKMGAANVSVTRMRDAVRGERQ